MKSEASKEVTTINQDPLSLIKPLSERQYSQLAHSLFGNELKNLIQEQIALDRRIIKECRKQLDLCPPGNMIVCRQSNARYSYYYNEGSSNQMRSDIDVHDQDRSTEDTIDPENSKPGAAKTSLRYISRQNLPLLRTLAQKRYTQKLLTNAEKDLRKYQDILKHTDPNYPQTVYEKLSSPYRELITPILMTDDQYAEKWLEESFTPLSEYMPIGEALETRRGEKVRSKSELIIANALYEMDIPYKYERPLHLEITIYPDFTVLNKRTRQVFYWEHFGMMNDPDYVSKTMQKFDMYSSQGILPGEGLLFTYESETAPLKTQQVYTLIQQFLL